MQTDAINQLWVSDITYIHLNEEFVYLAVVLDAHSRRVIGWSLERYLTTLLALTALHMALETRRPQPGLIHHSDRGLQYACQDYTAVLEQHQIQISMSRPGNPYDNAKAESFMKTLKQEQLNGCQFRNLMELRKSVDRFLEQIYNRQRLHSALSYQTPEEFEQQSGTASSALNTTILGKEARRPLPQTLSPALRRRYAS
jgi:transposase InsO family protein